MQLGDEMRTGGAGLMFGLGLITGLIVMGLIWLLVKRDQVHMPSMPRGKVAPSPESQHSQNAHFHHDVGTWHFPGTGLGGYQTTYTVLQQQP